MFTQSPVSQLSLTKQYMDGLGEIARAAAGNLWASASTKSNS